MKHLPWLSVALLCASSCVPPRCGDFVLDPGEECDRGSRNGEEGEDCSAECTDIFGCGDGFLDNSLGEQCDDGNNTNDDGCSAECQSENAICGNAIVEVGEECDDADLINNNECNNDCLLPSCGDGVTSNGLPSNDPLFEECDDQNNLDTDGCSSLCVAEFDDGCLSGAFDGDESCFAVVSPQDFALGIPRNSRFADLDRDGNLDLISLDSSAARKLQIAIGSVTGLLTPTLDLLLPREARDVKLFDLDKDGELDIVTPNLNVAGVEDGVTIFFGIGDGTFQAPVNNTLPGDQASALELFEEGDEVRMALIHIISNTMLIARFDEGTRLFTEVQDISLGVQPLQVSAAPLDGDATLDLVVSSFANSEIQFYFNNGGSFALGPIIATGDATPPTNFSLTRLDGDNDFDLVVSIDPNDIGVFLNDGAGGFPQTPTLFTTGGLPRAMVSTDLNNDARVDIAVAVFNANAVFLLFGDGTGGFSTITTIDTGINPVTVDAGDVNGDTFIDLSVANFASDSVSVFRSLP
jgi:cysteine-rich repeat protein